MVAGVIIGVLTWVGCAVATDGEPTSVTTSTASVGPSGTPSPSVPVLVPDGSAEDNLSFFRVVMDSVWAEDQSYQGRAYIDALVAAGFPKADMEVTQDRTTVDNPADAIQFSVRWQGECLVGQVGPSTPAPTAVVLPEVPGGTCLIGQTRPIDW